MDTLVFTGAGLPVSATFAFADTAYQVLANLVGIALLIALSAFFVAAEYALVRSRPTRLEEMAEDGSRGARTALSAIRKMGVYLSATQVGVTVTTLLLGKIGQPVFDGLLSPLFRHIPIGTSNQNALALLVSIAVMAGLQVILGEQVPKYISINRAERMAVLLAPPITVFYRVMYVPVWILAAATNGILRAFGFDPKAQGEAHSPEEINLIVTSSEARGAVGADEAEMARNAIIIGDRNARDIMVPRVDMAFLTTSLSLKDNIARANKEGYTRFPLCDPDADHVIGMIHIKDLLSVATREDVTIRDARRDILVVPETKPLDTLLREFQASHIHMALVLDEWGGTSGIVTLEDVLEEIVGDIQDEHQHEHPEVESAGEHAWLVDGGVTLDDLERDLDVVLEAEDADTVAGFIQWQLGAVPTVGQEVVWEAYRLKVEAMEGRRVRSVLISRCETTNDAEDRK
jgi:CBS domain containing-hemolysin-like protein